MPLRSSMKETEHIDFRSHTGSSGTLVDRQEKRRFPDNQELPIKHWIRCGDERVNSTKLKWRNLVRYKDFAAIKIQNINCSRIRPVAMYDSKSLPKTNKGGAAVRMMETQRLSGSWK